MGTPFDPFDCEARGMFATDNCYCTVLPFLGSSFVEVCQPCLDAHVSQPVKGSGGSVEREMCDPDVLSELALAERTARPRLHAATRRLFRDIEKYLDVVAVFREEAISRIIGYDDEGGRIVGRGPVWR